MYLLSFKKFNQLIFSDNSSQWYSARRRLRQEIINARRNMSVGRLPGSAGSRFHTLASLHARNAADRQAAREVMRRHRIDRYRLIIIIHLFPNFAVFFSFLEQVEFC